MLDIVTCAAALEPDSGATDWYGEDLCAGSPPGAARLSLEYIQDIDAGPDTKYACSGSCAAFCQTQILGVMAEVYLR